MNSFIVVFKDDTLTKFMQAADMFEPSKVVLGHPTCTIQTTTEFDLFIERMKGLEGKDRVIAVLDIEGKQWWLDDTVKMVSNGSKWCSFEDYLRKLWFGFDKEVAK